MWICNLYLRCGECVLGIRHHDGFAVHLKWVFQVLDGLEQLGAVLDRGHLCKAEAARRTRQVISDDLDVLYLMGCDLTYSCHQVLLCRQGIQPTEY